MLKPIVPSGLAALILSACLTVNPSPPGSPPPVPPDAAATWTAVALTAFPPTPTPVGGEPIPGTPVPTPIPGADYASVTYVIDGDTIDVSLGGQDVRVRYIGVNTPERGEPCFDEATAANRALVEDRIVALVRDVSETDRYGRLLRYVYVGEVFVNAALVEAGWAEARRYPPDTLHADAFDALENSARATNLGCWPAGVFEP